MNYGYCADHCSFTHTKPNQHLFEWTVTPAGGEHPESGAGLSTRSNSISCLGQAMGLIGVGSIVVHRMSLWKCHQSIFFTRANCSSCLCSLKSRCLFPRQKTVAGWNLRVIIHEGLLPGCPYSPSLHLPWSIESHSKQPPPFPTARLR